VRNGPQWAHTAIIITYDEHGGFWDHVAPPVVDRWGPGSRVPTLIISPLARKHHVDHHRYDTTSILALIEARWRLAPLTSRDRAADPLTGSFQFAGPGPRGR
jgi:phospholipase C